MISKPTAAGTISYGRNVVLDVGTNINMQKMSVHNCRPQVSCHHPNNLSVGVRSKGGMSSNVITQLIVTIKIIVKYMSNISDAKNLMLLKFFKTL